MDKLIDRLGERLDFERRKAALYDALIAKARGAAVGPPVEDLERMRNESRHHAGLLEEALKRRGADPLLPTASAQTSSVITSGLSCLVEDPASTLPQCVSALLVAELADLDAWELLVQLAEEVEADDLQEGFAEALAREAAHVDLVRGWLAEEVLGHPRRAPARRGARPRRGQGRGTKPRAGVPGILDVHHRSLDRLFRKLAREATRSGRQMVFEQLAAAVSAHERVERGVLEPWLRERSGADLAAFGLIADERVREALVELERVGPDGERFVEGIERLRAELTRHAELMEEGLLARLGELFAAEDLQRLAQALRDAQEVAVAPFIVAETPAPSE